MKELWNFGKDLILRIFYLQSSRRHERDFQLNDLVFHVTEHLEAAGKVSSQRCLEGPSLLHRVQSIGLFSCTTSGYKRLPQHQQPVQRIPPRGKKAT